MNKNNMSLEVIEKISSLEKQKLELILDVILGLINNNHNNKEEEKNVVEIKHSEIEKILFEPIDCLGIPKKLCRFLRNKNIHLVGDIVCNPALHKKSYIIKVIFKGPISKIPNLDKKSYEHLVESLKKKGYTGYIDYPNYLEEREKKTKHKYQFVKF